MDQVTGRVYVSHFVQAVLAFEAEVQRNMNNSKGWQYLGQAHAENDKDSKAIACLLHAIEADSSNSDAYLALAVSYTNDMYRFEL